MPVKRHNPSFAYLPVSNLNPFLLRLLSAAFPPAWRAGCTLCAGYLFRQAMKLSMCANGKCRVSVLLHGSPEVLPKQKTVRSRSFLFSLSLTARGRGQKLTFLEFFKNFYALVMKKTVKRQISTHARCSAVLEKFSAYVHKNMEVQIIHAKRN